MGNHSVLAFTSIKKGIRAGSGWKKMKQATGLNVAISDLPTFDQ